MTKERFLEQLKNALIAARVQAVNDYLADYTELINDKIDAGQSEEAAVAGLGSVNEIVDQIRSDGTEVYPTEVVKAKTNPVLTALIVLLLVLGSPVWVPITLAVIIIIFVAYGLIWIVPAVSGFVGTMFLGVGSITIVLAIVSLFKATLGFGLLQFGISLALLGGGIILAGITWVLAKVFGRTTARLTKWLVVLFSNGRRGMQHA